MRQLAANSEQLPVGWQVKRLGDVFSLEYGKPLPKEQRDDNGKFPAYGANGIKCRTNQFYWDKPTIIVGRKGSAGEVNLTESKFWPLDVTYFVNFDENQYDLFFLYFCLLSLNLQKLAKGVKPGINRNDVYSIGFAFPKLPEQKRIVAILDEAFAGISQAVANTEKNLANARELFESYLNGVFARKGEGRIEKKLDEECDILMGQSPAGTSYNIDGEGVPLINGPVEFGGIDPFSKTVATKFTTKPTKMCNLGDLILCVRGSTTGRMNIAGQNACIGRGVAAIRSENNQDWINQFISFSRGKIYAMGSGATFPNVSASDLKKIVIPFPPKKQRKIIVDKINNLTSKVQNLETIYQKKLTALAELKQSILQKAFRGELSD